MGDGWWPPDDRFPSEAWVLASVGVVLAGVVLLAVVAYFFGIVALGVPQTEVEPAAPSAAFEATRTDAGVAVTMTGGDRMNASLVYVHVEDRRLGTWASLSDGGDGEVMAGDRITLDGVQRDRTLAVVYDDGSHATMLFTGPVPGTATPSPTSVSGSGAG